MVLGTSYFPISTWAEQCPESLDQLRRRFSGLYSSSSKLRSFLDEVISLVIIYEKEQANTKHSHEVQHYLYTLGQNLYALAAFLCDMSSVTYQDLLVIKAKRVIDPSYLPNHIIGEEPPYLHPELYERTTYSNTREGFIQKKPIIDAYLKKQEDMFRKTHRLKKLLSVARLLTRYRPPVDSINEESLSRPQRLAQNAPSLIPLVLKYYRNEALPKAILSTKVQLPKLKDINRLLESYQRAVSLESLQQLGLDEKQAEFFHQQFQNSVAKILEAAQSWVDNDSSNLSPETQISLAIHILHDMRHSLLSTGKFLEKEFRVNLASIKKKIVAVTPDYNPSLLRYYDKFRLKYPTFLQEGNSHLYVEYYDEELREAFRVHLYQGKFYQIVKTRQGDIQLRPFHTNDYTSHKKEGWATCVMNSAGEIFATSHQEGRFHSSFMSGAPVRFAGEMKVASDGTLLEVHNYSGHYMPTFEDLEEFARHLQKRGVDLSHCEFHAVDSEQLQNQIKQLMDSNLPAAKRESLKDSILTASEKLEVSKRYIFSEGKLIPAEEKKSIPYKKYLMNGALITAGVVGILLLIATVVLTQGATLPIFLAGTNYLATVIVGATVGSVLFTAALTGWSLTSGHAKKVANIIMPKIQSFMSYLFGSPAHSNTSPGVAVPVPAPIQPSPPTEKAHSNRVVRQTYASLPFSSESKLESKKVVQDKSTSVMSHGYKAKAKLLQQERDLEVSSALKLPSTSVEDYPEWLSFTHDIKLLCSQSKKAPAVLSALEISLDQLRNRIFRHKGGDELKRAEIWSSVNVGALLGTARETLRAQMEQDAFRQLERDFFKKAESLIGDFWHSFNRNFILSKTSSVIGTTNCRGEVLESENKEHEHRSSSSIMA